MLFIDLYSKNFNTIYIGTTQKNFNKYKKIFTKRYILNIKTNINNLVPRIKTCDIIKTMKKGLGLLILAVGFVFAGNMSFAQNGYTIVPLPDTIVQKTPIDAAIYNNTAEFFTPYIVNEINQTQFMNAPTVTEVRNKIQTDYWLTKTTTKAMDDFRRFYKLDFEFAKKIANLYDTNYVLLITSATDSTNYITRRTWWDFFNVPGASVLDPAYKINIYAVLIDTDKNLIVWNKSYQKTISVVENRIVATGYAPQTEQLQKIKDYSVYLAPRVARSLQDTLLTTTQKAVEANRIHTDYGSIDNVFTKKYRGLRQEIIDASVVPATKAREGYGIAKEKYNESKEKVQNIIEERKQKGVKTPSKEIEPVNFTQTEKTPEIPAVEFKTVEPKIITEEIKETATQIIEETQDTTKQIQSEFIQNTIDSTQEKTNKWKEEIKETVKELSQETTKNAPTTTAPVVEQKVSPQSESIVEEKILSPEPKIEEPIQAPLPTTEPKIEEPKQKELKIDKDIDKRTKELLKKAFKNKPIDNNELPVDSLIYPQPSDYLPVNYVPSKPRLREINTNDTYNAF